MVISVPAVDIYKFGEALIETQDLDPVYVAIYRAGIAGKQLSRLLMGYWMFYHLGLAAWLSDQGKDFWPNATLAAINEQNSPLGGRWPRGAERRHFRGQKCIDAVIALAMHDADWHVRKLADAGPAASAVIAAATKLPMFGSWISYKIADMLERVVGVPLKFEEDWCLMYDEPAKALTLHAAGNDEQKAYRKLLTHFGKIKAPPNMLRACNVQEVETVLCKWKSAVNGHYWVGKDIHEISHGLVGWGKTAGKLLSHLPNEPLHQGRLF
jgi:hypothetical protein